MRFGKINNKAFKRFIATGLIVITAATFTGCGVNAKEKQANDSFIETTTKASINDSRQVIKETVTGTPAITEKPVDMVKPVVIETPIAIEVQNDCDKLLDSLDDKEVTIDDTTSYMLDNMDKISATDDKITDEEMYIASYAYQKLLKSNIDKEVFLKELNTIMVEQLLPRGMDEEEWLLNFGNLTSTLNEQESLQDTYLVLAYLIHDMNCDEKHTTSEYGSIDCKVLQKEFKDKYK